MTDNTPVRIGVNKIENRVTFKIKTGYYLELLTLKTMKLLRSARSKLTKDEILVQCNILNNDCQQDSRVLYTFISNK